MTDTWVRSSYCNGGGCPEVAHRGGRVEIRDSERQDEVTWFTAANWQAFVAGVKAGEFDVPQAGICQVAGVGIDRITCPEHEHGGLRCERTDPHTDGHRVGAHTIAHFLAGNGYECSAIVGAPR